MIETTAPVLAWHGNPDLKAAAVARMRAHAANDSIIRGHYGKMLNDNPRRFAGCFHGCLTVETLAAERGCQPVQVANTLSCSAIHEAGERLWGIPARLGAVLDEVFEGQPGYVRFAVRATEAIPVGADLSLVVDRWMLDVLTDGTYGAARGTTEGSPERAAIDAVADLYRRRIVGDEPTTDEWHEASRQAAAHAYAENAAYNVYHATIAASSAAVCAVIVGNNTPGTAADSAAFAVGHTGDTINRAMVHMVRDWQGRQIIHHIAETAPR